MRKYILLGLFFSCMLASSEAPLFQVPADWEFALPKNHSPFVLLGFVKKKSGPVAPSINLATESTTASLKQYIQSVKELYTTEKNTTWHDLGPFTTKAGLGHLLEISKSTPLGELKLLQLLFIHNQTAYILTAAMSKKDYIDLHPLCISMLQSFTIEKNLLCLLPEKQQKQIFSFFTALEKIPERVTEKQRCAHWEELQKMVLSDCAFMGGCWQFFALKEGREKIYSSHKALAHGNE